jgi:predicted aminopeptidase
MSRFIAFISSLLLTLLFSGCAKLSYITSQSIEQIKLVSMGESIDTVIKKKETPEKVKRKLTLVKEYKLFFSKYFNEDLGDIYRKVIFLDRDSVSHLVVSSSWNEIKPIEECFIFMGCFPYLGFFQKKSALNFRDEMISKGMSSHVRPVNAYSTLGHFNDRILSSFFNYSDKALANLIFHELVHSVIFFKNGVNFNENIANFIADKLVTIYFNETKREKILSEKKALVFQEINSLMSEKTKKINEILKSEDLLDKKKMMKFLISKEFGVSFRNELVSICRNKNLEKSVCTRFDKNWSPSQLAALGTYNKLQDEIEAYYRKNFKNIGEFYNYLKGEYLKGHKTDQLLKSFKQKK